MVGPALSIELAASGATTKRRLRIDQDVPSQRQLSLRRIRSVGPAAGRAARRAERALEDVEKV